MCACCGEPGRHRFAIAERPAQRLRGVAWEGSYAEAAAGAIHPLIEQMKAVVAGGKDPWFDAIVGISWNDRPDGFRYFVGIQEEKDQVRIAQHGPLSLPPMRYASVWHSPDDGDVISHYGRMIEWIETEGECRDISVLHHREEYPADIDVTAAPVLRLMLPLASAGNRLDSSGS